VLMSTAYQMDEESANVTPGNFGARGWMAAIGGLAAAAAIAVMVVQPSSLFGTDIDDLKAASQSLPKRQSEGRLAGFAYNAEPDSVKRGGNDKGEDDGLAAKAKLLHIRADLAGEKSPDPHVVGVSTLLIAEERADFSEAVADLKKAHEQARGADRDTIAIDLAAALIAKARWSGDEDYRDALRLSEDVLTRKRSPEALWNRAVATQALSDKDQALRAWDDYLMVDNDPGSPWAKEAMKRQAELKRDF
jgi:tetratricopeptide (TPR) repeat protein